MNQNQAAANLGGFHKQAEPVVMKYKSGATLTPKESGTFAAWAGLRSGKIKRKYKLPPNPGRNFRERWGYTKLALRFKRRFMAQPKQVRAFLLATIQR